MRKLSLILVLVTGLSQPIYAQEEEVTDTELLEDNEILSSDFIEPEIESTEITSETIEETTEETKDDFIIPEDDDEEAVPSDASLATHQLTFEFTTHITFTHDDDISPYMEVQYTNKIEANIDLGPRRTSNNATLNYDIQNWGYLSQTELVTCNLEIIPSETPVEIKGKMTTDINSETGYTAYLRIDLMEPILEDWLSTCSDGSATISSRGDTEKYNMMVMQSMEPQMSSYVLENFNPAERNQIEIIAPTTPLEDPELSQTLMMWGEGNIVIEPL